MEGRKFIRILVPTMLGLFILGAPSALAYGIETHAYLTSEIINFYNQSYSNNQIPGELRNYLIDGSRKEDEAPRWLNHFYDPVYDRGLITTQGIKGYNSKSWAQNASMQSEVRFKVSHFIASLLSAAEQRKISEISADADFTWNRAIQFYVNGENEKAMFALGHVMHLIEDLGVPDHTRNDDHAEGSPYENFAKRFNLSNSDSGLSSRLSGKGVISLNNLDGYFNSLATYSNSNFYSEDTIGIHSGYNLPQIADYEVEGKFRFARGQDETGFYKLFAQPAKSSAFIDIESNVIVGHDEVMTDYWNHLSPKVVQHGAGVVNLFFQEAEKAKNDPKFAKKEKKNFLTKAVDAAKTAFNQVFNKSENKPVAVIDVSQERQKEEQKIASPTVFIDKTTVAQGENLVEGGQGFSPDSDVLMQFDIPNGRTATVSMRTDSSGAFRKDYVMPTNALLGQYAYYVKDLKTNVTSNKVNYVVKGTIITKKKAETKKEVQEVKKEEQKKEVQKKPDKVTGLQVKECSFDTSQPPSHNEIIINEAAWMGGSAGFGLNANDEWIELKNLTSKPIDISGWQLISRDENIEVVFKEGSIIPANGFYLLERTNDQSVPGTGADLIYTGALANSDEGLRLFSPNCSLVDEVLADPDWPAGDSSARRTMQRESDLSWSTYGAHAVSSIFGTPKAKNGPALVIEEKDTSKKSTTKKTSDSTSSGSSGSSGGGGSSSNASGEQAATGLLITEVQITGGSGKTDYDFVELFNPNSTSVNLKGHRLVKRTKTGTSDTSIKSWTSDTIILANSYYLWANSNHAELGVTPDVTTTGTISNDNGVAIRFGAENTGTIVDSVGWGEAANVFVEGSVFATNPGANESINRRTGSGFIDTGNNANDFELKTCLTPKAAPCAPANQAPSASFTFSPQNPETNQTVTFSGASSTDADGSISYYFWDFGDSSSASSTNASTTHSYSSAASYQVSLTVFDNQNASSTATSTITVTNSSSLSSVLFEQSDSSGGILLSGGQFFSLGSGANGSANKLKVKFKPDNVLADNQFYVAPWRIRENGGAELDFWYAASTTFANQPKYCFTTAESGVFKNVVFTFASALNFLASKAYDVYLLFLRDQPGNVCANNENTGTGNNAQGTWAANAANTLIYFQVGS